MLTALSIRDVVLIERLDLLFGAGLTVLTGETGAGKSILLDSLGLALGARADSGLVRAGAEQASVTACFAPPRDHPVLHVLAEQGIALEEDEVVVRRVVSRDGRSRATVNDQPVSVALLRRAGSLLVEVQGQGDQMGLADPAVHTVLLDAFGVPPGLRTETAAAWGRWREADGALERARAALADAEREEDWLRHATAELGELAPERGRGGPAGRRAAASAAARAPGRGDRRRAGRDRAARPPQPRAGRLAPRRLPRPAAARGRPGAPAPRSPRWTAPRKRWPRPRPCSAGSRPRRKAIRACWSRRRSGCSRCVPRPASMASRSPSFPRCWRRCRFGSRRSRPARPSSPRSRPRPRRPGSPTPRPPPRSAKPAPRPPSVWRAPSAPNCRRSAWTRRASSWRCARWRRRAGAPAAPTAPRS